MRITSPAVKRVVAGVFLGVMLWSGTWADIAVLRPIGPKTGSGFSTPGRIYDEAQAVPVAMENARVAIRLNQLGTGEIEAKCEADFELRHTDAGGAIVEFLVGFPITGQARNRSMPGVMTIRGFAVLVDDAPPPLARREFRWGSGKPHFTEEIFQAKLDGRFALPPVDLDPPATRSRPTYPGHRTGNIGAWILYGEREERAAFSEQDFLWTQKITPGARQKVIVRYALTLRAQRLAYPEMGYDKLWTVEPEQVAKTDKSRRYFFFDYVLRSGATWEGPIGRETITLTAEPGVDLDGLVSFGRKARREGAAWVWELVNEDPTEDVLIALPL